MAEDEKTLIRIYRMMTDEEKESFTAFLSSLLRGKQDKPECCFSPQ